MYTCVIRKMSSHSISNLHIDFVDLQDLAGKRKSLSVSGPIERVIRIVGRGRIEDNIISSCSMAGMQVISQIHEMDCARNRD